MFQGCTSLTSLNAPFNTASAEDKATAGNERAFDCMFLGCTNLESVELGDDFVVPSKAGFTRVFEDCKKLQQIPDLSKCITSNASNLNRLFFGCTGLTSVDMSDLNLSGVETMQSMFGSCTGLETVKFGNLNSSKLQSLEGLFSGCSKLTSASFTSLSTGNSCTMQSLFNDCTSLENLDLSTWDTSKVTNMNNLFNGCSKLATLDLSSWNTKSVGYFSSMFDGCTKLSTLKLGENFSFRGTNPTTSTTYWALLPEHSTTAPYNGLWWKGPGTTTYTRYTMRTLSPAETAGTWTWSEGIAVTLGVSEHGTARATSLNTGNEGDEVTLEATPDEGYEFLAWQRTSGDGTGTLSSTTDNPTTFTLGSANGTVKATFKEITHTYDIGALSATSFTYNGAMQAPTVAVTDSTSSAVLTAGTHYTVSYEKDGSEVASPVDVGTYTLYVTGAGDYANMPKTSAGTFVIAPVSIAGKALSLSRSSFTYNNKVQKPTVKAVGGQVLKAGTDYRVVYSDASSKAAGNYTVKVKGIGNYTGTSEKATYTIAKAENPITLAKKTVTVKYAKLKKAKQKAAINKAKNAQGTVRYSITKAVKGKKSFKAKFSINKRTGKVTIAKGLAKGTYKLTVMAKAAGNGNYKSGFKTAVVTVNVK